jgi:hypothetical protein
LAEFNFGYRIIKREIIRVIKLQNNLGNEMQLKNPLCTYNCWGGDMYAWNCPRFDMVGNVTQNNSVLERTGQVLGKSNTKATFNVLK